MTDLIQRLQEAEGPDRELDDLIQLATGDDLEPHFEDEFGPMSEDSESIIQVHESKHYTSSLDAKIPGENITRTEFLGDQHGWSPNWRASHKQKKFMGRTYQAEAKTEAIARRLAALMDPEINPDD